MNNGLFISHKEAFNVIAKDHKWAAGYFTEEDVLYSIKEVIRLVGAKNVYEDTFAFIYIDEGRGSLPEDIIYIDTVARTDKDTVEEAINCDCPELYPMQWMTDKIKRRLHSSDLDARVKSDYTYTVNNNYIFCNFESGVVCLFYQKMATDDNGYLLIPNDESYLQAVMYQTTYKVANDMYMSGKLDEARKNYQLGLRNHYVKQAGNSTRIPSPDERAAQKNSNLSWPGEYHPERNFHLNMYRHRTLKSRTK